MAGVFFTHNPTRWTKTIDSESVYIPTELKNQSTYQQKIYTAPNILMIACVITTGKKLKKREKKVVGNCQRGGRNILGHFKHHFGSQISLEWFKQVYILWMKPEFAIKISLIIFVSFSMQNAPCTIVLPTLAHRKYTCCDLETRSNIKGACAYWNHKYDITHFLLQILASFAPPTWIILVIFVA